MQLRKCSIFLLLTISGKLACFAKVEPEIVNLMYSDRPPFAITIEGKKIPQGLHIDPIEKAFEESGIPHRWIEVPIIRQLAILKENSGLDCGVGWFEREERKVFAKYSVPFFQDSTSFGIVSKNSPLPASTKIKTVLSDNTIVWTIIDGYSYPPYMEKLMKEYQTKTQVINGNMRNLIKMVANNRISITLLTIHEAQYYLKKYKDRLRTIEFTDLPPGENRHLICSFKVSDDLLDKINKKFQKAHTTARK